MNLQNTLDELTTRLREHYPNVHAVPKLCKKLMPGPTADASPAVKTVRAYNIFCAPAYKRDAETRERIQHLAPAVQIVDGMDLPHDDLRVLGDQVVIFAALLDDHTATATLHDTQRIGPMDEQPDDPIPETDQD